MRKGRPKRNERETRITYVEIGLSDGSAFRLSPDASRVWFTRTLPGDPVMSISGPISGERFAEALREELERRGYER